MCMCPIVLTVASGELFVTFYVNCCVLPMLHHPLSTSVAPPLCLHTRPVTHRPLFGRDGPGAGEVDRPQEAASHQRQRLQGLAEADPTLGGRADARAVREIRARIRRDSRVMCQQGIFHWLGAAAALDLCGDSWGENGL